MNAIDLAARLHARHSPRGWIAKCPAHDDRHPSLSISEGLDGRTLLKCHAGCETAAIASSLGLKLTDLFKDDRAPSRGAWPRRLTVDEIETALREECARIAERESASTGFDVAELARHRNAAREVIGRRYNVALKPELVPWFEIEPHCIDAAWKACVDRALDEETWELGLELDELVATLERAPSVRDWILLRARQLQRELAKADAA